MATEFFVPSATDVEKRFSDAEKLYQDNGVDVAAAIARLEKIRVSVHCWQGDDVGGFEKTSKELTGGIMATGSFPGKARNPDELRRDISKALSLIPGKHRLNLHAIYLENNGKFVDRDQVEPGHFAGWIDWARQNDVKLDFNPTFFSHPKSASGFTLSSADESVRKFWVEHGRRCRKIAAVFAKELGGKSVVNFWVPDGFKDYPADRFGPRKRLALSYDEIFADDAGPDVRDAVEGKLFGIGSEEYVVGSNEFYLAYAVSRKKMPCLDMGHYHPTESIHDKISAILAFLPEVLLHVSRPVRWDSDHVVVLNDDLVSLARELARGDCLDKVWLATDFFDAGINRIGAWVVGVRNLQKALLFALLEPVGRLRSLEAEGRGAERLALMEEAKSLPFGAVWDHFCMKSGVPVGSAWINEMVRYQKDVLSARN